MTVRARVLMMLLAAVALAITSACAPATSTPPNDDIAPDDALLRESLRDVFMAQEIFYSHPANKYAYASDAALLQQYRPRDGVTLTVFEGTAEGWSGMVRASSGNACVMYVGKVSKPPTTPKGVVATKPARGSSLEMMCDGDPGR
jgi:hypothetical protein